MKNESSYLSEEQITEKLIGYGVSSYNRILVFAKLSPKIIPMDYWSNLSYAYEASDNFFAHYPLTHLLFQYPEGNPLAMMVDSEHEVFNSLPEQFTIYRGMSQKERASNDYGFSRTLEKSTAEFLAEHYIRNFNASGKTGVYEISIDKDRCLGYLNGRSEKEIFMKTNKFKVESLSDFYSQLDEVMRPLTNSSTPPVTQLLLSGDVINEML